MYQSASIAGMLTSADTQALGTPIRTAQRQAWARPGQAARWAAAAPKPAPEWVSGPELTAADKPLMDPAEQTLDIAMAGATMLADVWATMSADAMMTAINNAASDAMLMSAYHDHLFQMLTTAHYTTRHKLTSMQRELIEETGFVSPHESFIHSY